MFNDFVKVFKEISLDKIIITDIYIVEGREKKEILKKVSSKKLVKKINKKNIIYLEKDKLSDYIKKNKSNIDVLFIMGAGDIYQINI